ncbi:MAG TPA: helix-turn-helix domain-containing protein [Vicinamibacterales bacterium]|nr:helix-turn-helix domain-containing protein [Vicinamibacterales bacterium]
MAANLTPVFIRLPRDQAAALDRLADRSGRSKQHVVSELVGQALAAPRPLPLALGRVELSSAVDTRTDEVLMLDEVASLLKLSAAAVRRRAESGDLPGRRFGSEWRFSKLAVLAWLADGDRPRGRRRG